MSSSEWSGEIDLGRSWALFVGRGGETRRHAHLAHKLVVALDADGDVEGAEKVADRVWFVRSDVQHRVLVPETVALAFVDAGTVGLVKVDAIGNALAQLGNALRAASCEGRIAALQSFVGALPTLPDARVARAARLLREAPHAELTTLADRVGLSLPRLSHLFASRIGLSPRKYRTWGALRRAVDEMATGMSLTEAAHSAGFADAAHFSRAFVAMFGVVPSTLSRSTTIRRHEV